jgi:hypothetical protein
MICYGVSLTRREIQHRDIGDIAVSVTNYYVGRQQALRTGRQHEATLMTRRCAEQLAEWLASSTNYSTSVIELIGDGYNLPDSLVALGEILSLEQLQTMLNFIISQNIYTRDEVLETVQHAVQLKES